MSEKIDIRKAVRDAEVSLTGKRYCTSCQSMQPALTGRILEGKRNRWQCYNCTKKISSRKYGKDKGEGDA
jgi:ribosomal protein L37AE/L43A